MAERRSGQSKARKTNAKPAAKGGGSKRQSGASGQRTERAGGSTAGRSSGLSASEAVARARGALTELLGLPVEGVLGIDRDHGSWVATVQVVELARIPNTTDVLGEYETVLDSQGELVRYRRKRRYHRGQVDGGQS